MFILDADHIPATAGELTTAIDQSLRKWIHLPDDSATVRLQGDLPNLSSLTIDVSHGQIDSPDSLPFEMTSAEVEKGPSIQLFSIVGQPISISDIPLQLKLTAQRAVFAYARNPNKNLIATLQEASVGNLSLQLPQTDLEAAALSLARRFAGNAIVVQKIEITLTSLSKTQVKVLLNITAKKFVTAIVRVSGLVRIDEQMVATASDLKASSDGMVGTIAVNLLQPQLKKLENMPLPLLAFSLGNLKVGGVEIHTTDGLQISASFGSND